MSESQKNTDASSDQPKKPMSPLEKIRAAAAASSGGAGKPMSPLEKIRAAQAAKQPEGGDTATPKGESPAAKPAEAKEKPAKPLPPKPEKAKAAEAKAGGSRRFFLFTWIGVAWAAFIAGCMQALAGTVRFMYPNVLQEPPTLFKIGAADKFDDGNVYEQWKNEYGVWIVKNEGKLYAIRTVCTHLGCTPNWLEGEQKFKCPCHGSGFRKTGINFEGPAPRPLERFSIAIADDGQVQIDKSKKWQQELGQWTEENGAFVKIS